VTATSYSCTECRFSLWLPLRRLAVSSLGLYDDARFPGRCLLVLDAHHDDFAAVPSGLLSAYMADVQAAGRAIAAATGADRVNYAVLGNAEPHVHFHLIPRVRATDPVPSQAPWETPVPKTALGPARLEQVSADLRAALERGA
jgi:diadenosine tetraphosphate (Ap4A) HIT family hydrolase